ncbi:cytochrome c family protein [Thalassococcus sp. S3]|uniref:c-type cytochrome n=1 Tax=Thalassococcus sp. S3 TaxID=2017482 RepID=UPI0010247930|nr:cytochrome C [Thalassococcus sp. S3]QBF34233.1 cytochrome C [Thalassococcus sp. S3]
MNRTIATLIAGLLAAPVFADGHASGDAAAGEKAFNKCKSCHMIVADDDTEIVKGGRTGPNLYGIVGRQAGTIEGFRYGDDLVAAGEAGLVWDEANFVEYVQDPRAFLRAYLDDSKARSKMSFKLRDGGADVYAYLASVGPAEEAATN